MLSMDPRLTATPDQKTWNVGTLTYTKAGLVGLFAWLLWGDFCFTIMEQVIPSIMPLKFKELGASNTLMALVMTSVPSLLTTVFNPIISFKSDRTRTKWGRRIPYLLGTVPFLTFALLALGVQEPVGRWIQSVAEVWFAGLSLPTVLLIYICFFLLVFKFFDIFVSCIFWYFFNDVVPERLMARFVSWFRIVNAGASTLYNWFVFKHAETHFMEIFVGAGLLYLVGFGLMCLMVKEGKYAPPPENIGRKTGALASVRTYFTECMTIRHYWFLYLTSLGGAITGCANLYIIFQQRHLGLDLEHIGKLSAINNVSYIIWIALLGFLADRYHPLRIAIIGKIAALVLAPLGLIWLFWRPPAETVFYFYAILGMLGTTAVGALQAIVEIPLLMRIFPRAQYGQFCSARAMCGSFFGISASAATGLILDHFQKQFGDGVYLFLPIWSIVGLTITITCLFLLYRSWKAYGGLENYVAPVPGHQKDKTASQASSVGAA